MWLEEILSMSQMVLPNSLLNNTYLEEKGFESFRPDGENSKEYYEYFFTRLIAIYIDGEDGRIVAFDFSSNEVVSKDKTLSILKELKIKF